MGLNSTKIPLYDEQGHHRAHASKKPKREVATPISQFAQDFARGRVDIEFFAWRFLGIRGNPGQIPWWKACAQRAEDGWRPEYLTTCVSAGNRAGKTLAMAVVVFHHAFYKLGVRPPEAGSVADSIRWHRAPYEWYHVGPQQEIAEIVHAELVRILSGIHAAQGGRGCPLMAALNSDVVTWDKKYRGEYLWIQIHSIFGGGQIHFRTTQDKAKALLGKDMNGISFDEAAVEIYLPTIFQEVLNLRRLSTGGPLHFISTPTEGFNAYADIWEAGNPENPGRDPQVMSFRLSTRDNIGYGISRPNFDAMVRQIDPRLIPQNIDGEFIEGESAYFGAQSVEGSFDTELPAEVAPGKGHRYVQGVDPGISADATWAITLDSTVKPFVGVRARKRGGKQLITAVVNMVREGHLLYQTEGNCTTIIDSTGMGGAMFRQEFSSAIRPVHAFDFAGTKARKLELLADLKVAMDKGWIKLPRGGAWDELRRQLLGYKLKDEKITQDAVMALAVAVRHALRSGKSGIQSASFSFFGGSD